MHTYFLIKTSGTVVFYHVLILHDQEFKCINTSETLIGKMMPHGQELIIMSTNNGTIDQESGIQATF